MFDIMSFALGLVLGVIGMTALAVYSMGDIRRINSNLRGQVKMREEIITGLQTENETLKRRLYGAHQTINAMQKERESQWMNMEEAGNDV